MTEGKREKGKNVGRKKKVGAGFLARQKSVYVVLGEKI